MKQYKNSENNGKPTTQTSIMACYLNSYQKSYFPESCSPTSQILKLILKAIATAVYVGDTTITYNTSHITGTFHQAVYTGQYKHKLNSSITTKIVTSKVTAVILRPDHKITTKIQ